MTRLIRAAIFIFAAVSIGANSASHQMEWWWLVLIGLGLSVFLREWIVDEEE
jgi:hypothetical protein